MALNLEDKKALVAEVAEVAAKAHSVVAAEYRGLTVGQMTELRSKARKSGVYARVVKDFSKANDKLVATLVSLGGQVFPGAELEKVASLPTREQALSMLLGVMKAPIQKFVRTLAEPPAKLARTLAAVRDQKQAAGA